MYTIAAASTSALAGAGYDVDVVEVVGGSTVSVYLGRECVLREHSQWQHLPSP